MSNKIKFDFSTFRNGLLMGMADAVPGVSGGTIALILGIYNKLIFSLSDFLTFIRKKFPSQSYNQFMLSFISLEYYSSYVSSLLRVNIES